jgi:hypothetical protein
MHSRTHSVTWQGQTFRFECLPAKGGTGDLPQWAVSREREFIGTMSCSLEVTTKDFDVRCLRWLAELLHRAERGAAHPTS